MKRTQIQNYLDLIFDRLAKVIAVDEGESSDEISKAVQYKTGMFLWGELTNPILRYSYFVKKLNFNGPNNLNTVFFPPPVVHKKEDYSVKGMEAKEKMINHKKANAKSASTKAAPAEKKSTGIMMFFKRTPK